MIRKAKMTYLRMKMGHRKKGIKPTAKTAYKGYMRIRNKSRFKYKRHG